MGVLYDWGEGEVGEGQRPIVTGTSDREDVLYYAVECQIVVSIITYYNV